MGLRRQEGACTDGPHNVSEGDRETMCASWQRPQTPCFSTCSGRRQVAVPRPALTTGSEVPAPGDSPTYAPGDPQQSPPPNVPDDPWQSPPPDHLAVDFVATRMLWQLPSLLKLLGGGFWVLSPEGPPPQQSFEGHYAQ